MPVHYGTIGELEVIRNPNVPRFNGGFGGGIMGGGSALIGGIVTVGEPEKTDE